MKIDFNKNEISLILFSLNHSIYDMTYCLNDEVYDPTIDYSLMASDLVKLKKLKRKISYLT